MKKTEVQKTKLQKIFTIANISLLGIFTIPVVGLMYTAWFLFLPVVGFSIYNYVMSIKQKQKNKIYNLLILIGTVVGIIPVLGWLPRVGALVLSIISLVILNKGE